MPIQRLQQRSGGVTELLLDAEKRLLLTGDDDGVIYIWALENTAEPVGIVEPSFLNIDAMAWLPGHTGFVAAGREGIGGWRIDGSHVGSWPALESAQSLAIVSEDRALVACEASVKLIDFEHGCVVTEVSAGERNTGIAAHPDGQRYVVSSCDQGGSQLLCLAVEGDTLRELGALPIERKVDHLSSPAIDKRGELLMVADHRLGIFRLADGRRVAGFDANGRTTRIRLSDGLSVERFWTQCVALGEQRLACASPEGPVLVYDGSSGKMEIRAELDRPATALASDGDVLAASGLDWTTTIWWPDERS